MIFKDLPDNTTPINAENLNKNATAISPVQPVNGEEVWIQKGKNLFNVNNAVLGYLDENGNEGSTDFWVITDYIEVEAQMQYTYSGLTNVGTAPYSAFYDKNKNFVSSFKQKVGINTITIPDGVCYVRFSIDNGTSGFSINNIPTFQIEKGTKIVAKKIFTKNNFGNYEEFIANEDTGWVNGTLDSSMILSTNVGFKYGNGIQARIKNGVLYVRISISKNTGNFSASDGEVTIGEMPTISGYDFTQIFKDTLGNMARGSVFGAGTATGFLQIKGNVIQVRLTNDQSANWIVGMVAIPLN